MPRSGLPPYTGMHVYPHISGVPLDENYGLFLGVSKIIPYRIKLRKGTLMITSPKAHSLSRPPRKPLADRTNPDHPKMSELAEEVRQLRAALKLYRAVVDRLIKAQAA